MLFAYTYVPHQMEKMQGFIDFIFYEVWCKASARTPFSTDLFVRNSDLHEIMLAFQWGDTAGGDFFYTHVESIYGQFLSLTSAEISQFKQWYKGNNDLEKVCTNDPATQLARYADIAVNHQNLSQQLASFFKGLYSQSLLGLAILREKIGEIDDHYNSFVKINNAHKCPFCGIADLLSEHHTPRDAYDHYLPKALYPFNSINFYNLIPACHHCNSSYKTSKDLAYLPKDPARALARRKFFYPFSVTPYAIELQVSLQHSDFESITPADVTLQFGPAAISEEIETWKDVYGIEERYKAKLCAENDGKYWLTQVLDEWSEGERSPGDFIATLSRQTTNRPYAECNFLKKPFLDACEKAGIFSNVKSA